MKGHFQKKPQNIVEEREYNGLQILTGQAAIVAYGDRARSRPVFNHYKSQAVSEKKENDKTLSISNGSANKVVIEYSSDRIGDIDVVINQEYKQLITERFDKAEKSIRIELDPKDWPPYNFTISVYKAGTDYGIDSRLHRITDGQIEIDYITEDNIKSKFEQTQRTDDSGALVNYISIPGEQLRLPEGFYKQINFIVNSLLFKVSDSDFISYWHRNLRGKYGQKEYKRYVTTRFHEEAENLGFDIEFDDASNQMSIKNQDKSYHDITILSWLHQQTITFGHQSYHNRRMVKR